MLYNNFHAKFVIDECDHAAKHGTLSYFSCIMRHHLTAVYQLLYFVPRSGEAGGLVRVQVRHFIFDQSDLTTRDW
jgi:hypothetical protein